MSENKIKKIKFKDDNLLNYLKKLKDLLLKITLIFSMIV